MTNGEDWKYFAELAICGLRYQPCNEIVSIYRIHSNSTIGADLLKDTTELKKFLNGLVEIFGDMNFIRPNFRLGSILLSLKRNSTSVCSWLC